VKHALAVVAGIAVGLPVMAALASANGHTRGGLPDRYVPWAQQHRLRTGYAAIRTPVRAPRTKVVRRARMLTSHSPSPSASSEPTARPAARTARHAGPAAGLIVTIDAPHTVRPGGTYTYRIQLANHGPGTPGEITVRNTLPSGVERTRTSLPGGAGGYARPAAARPGQVRDGPVRRAGPAEGARGTRRAQPDRLRRRHPRPKDERERREGGNPGAVGLLRFR
jgi:uncharacterized repeat protein (TIGR01451 family)